MKRILFTVMAWLVMSVFAFAGWEGAGFYMLGGGGTNVHYFAEKPNNPNITFVGGAGEGGAGDAEAYAKAQANAVANAKAIANQKQNQVQKQQQGQQQKQVAVGSVKTNVSTNVSVEGDTYIAERPYMNAPNLVQTDVPILQTGKIGDFTGAVPNIGGLKPLMNEKVIRVVAVYSGSIFWRIRLEDVVSKLIEKGSIHNEEGNIRYSIWFKDSVTSGCVGLPMSGAASDSGMSGSIGSTNGYCQSTANPQFIITFYEVQ